MQDSAGFNVSALEAGNNTLSIPSDLFLGSSFAKINLKQDRMQQGSQCGGAHLLNYALAATR
jgi:hypothetical protein